MIFLKTLFTIAHNFPRSIQRDSATVDLGYVFNTGRTLRQKDYNATEDDSFSVALQVQLADNAMTDAGQELEVHFAVGFGDIVLTGIRSIFLL